MEFPTDIDSYVFGKTDFILDVLRRVGLTAEQLASIERVNRKGICREKAGFSRSPYSSALRAMSATTDSWLDRRAGSAPVVYPSRTGGRASGRSEGLLRVGVTPES